MDISEKDCREAAWYLRDNAMLRAALGVAGDELLEPHRLGVGEHNRNFWFCAPQTGRKYVLRVNILPQPFHENQVAYEYAALAALEASGCTPKPVYLDDTEAALGKGVVVETFCEGGELDFDHLQPGDLQCAAQTLADVHAVRVAEACPLHRPRDPLRELFDECMQRLDAYHASAFEDERVTKWADLFAASARRMLDVPCQPADCRHIINTETLPSHFLIPAAAAGKVAEGSSVGAAQVGEAHGKDAPAAPVAPSGFLIDWERPIVGEVAQDVAYFVSPTTTFWDSDYLFSAREAEAFVEDYWRAVARRFERGSFDERFRAWRAMTALRSVSWCCRALIRYGRAGSSEHKTSKTARKLPVYLSDEFMERIAAECFGL